MTPEQLAASGTEHGHQVALFAWAATEINKVRDYNFPKQNEQLAAYLKLMFAIPNGGLRHKAEANKLKAEGVKSGVPDIFLPVAVRSKNSLGHYDESFWHGLFIEMKKPSEKPSITLSGKPLRAAGKVSSNQAAWHEALQTQGYQVAVCYSWQEACDVILQYLGV